MQPPRAVKNAILSTPPFPLPRNARPHPTKKSVNVMIGMSREEGAAEGLFAAHPIRPRQFIAWYRGIRMPIQDAEDPAYLSDYVWADPAKGIAFDAAHPDSCAGRYANDGFSQDSNAKIMWQLGYKSPCLFATRPIAPHEEILVEYGASYWTRSHLSRLPSATAARCRAYYGLSEEVLALPCSPTTTNRGQVRFSLYEFLGWEGSDASGRLRLVLGPTSLPRAWDHELDRDSLRQDLLALFRHSDHLCKFLLRNNPEDCSTFVNVCKADGTCAFQVLYLQAIRAAQEPRGRDNFAHGPCAPHLDYSIASDRLSMSTFLEETLTRLPHLAHHVRDRVRACIQFLHTYTPGTSLPVQH